MADMVLGSKAFFDRGLDRVIDTPDAPVLPDTAFLAPWTEQRVDALDELLFYANLESLLDAFVRPLVMETELLSPMRFRRKMQGVAVRLKRGADAVRAVDPAAAAVIDAGARVVDEEVELRLLLELYQLALLRG